MSSETLTIPFEIIDPDGHAIFLEYDKGSDAESIMPNTDGTMRLILKGSAAEIGTYTLKITAIDEYGMATRSRRTVLL